MNNKLNWFIKWRQAGIVGVLFVAVFCDAYSLRAQDGFQSDPDNGEWAFELRVGDNFWSLSREHFKEPEVLDEFIGLNEGHQIHFLRPGSRLKVMKRWLKNSELPTVITSVQGEVTISKNEMSELAVPGPLQDPLTSIISTGADSWITIEFLKGTSIELAPHSTMGFDSLSLLGNSLFADIQVRLLMGTARAILPHKTPADSKLRIWTKPAVTSVRGTEYRVHVESQQSVLRAETLAGAVAVSAQSETVMVQSGFGSQVEAGAAPEPVQKLLRAPDLSAINPEQKFYPVTFTWPPVPEAKQYLITVLDRSKDGTVEGVYQSADSSITLSDLEEGLYDLVIRAVDEQGFEGLEATSTINVQYQPQPPVLTAAGTIFAHRPTLLWQYDNSSARFDLQISTNPRFVPVSEGVQAYLGNFYETRDKYPLGQFFWRVRAITNRGTSSWSEVGRFSRANLPPPAELTLNAESRSEYVLSWERAEGAELTAIEIASDPLFETIIQKQVLQSEQLAFAIDEPGDYWVRAISLTDGGEVQSSPSKPLQIDVSNPVWPGLVGLGALLLALLL